MDRKTKSILNFITILFLFAVMIYIMTDNAPNKAMLLILFSLLCLSIVYRRIVIYKNNVNSFMCKISFLVESALTYWIALIDTTSTSQILFFILIGQVIIVYSKIDGLIFTIINFISYVIISYIKAGYPGVIEFLPNVANYFLSFTFSYGFMFIAKYQITQRDAMNKITKELEKAYNKLQENFDVMEEVTILKERNRIAGEIHDTVGHTLTTVLVEIEAGKRLMKKDTELSIEKLDLAQEQVRKGLNDIRKSVRTLKDGYTPLDFIDSIKALIHETEKHGGVKIESFISEMPKLTSDIEKTLYRALQESLTNGIRHGQSTKFKFSLKYNENKIRFSIKDNGCGCKEVELGFGLLNMKHRVEQCNGRLEVQSNLNEGCNVFIEIPINKE